MRIANRVISQTHACVQSFNLKVTCNKAITLITYHFALKRPIEQTRGELKVKNKMVN